MIPERPADPSVHGAPTARSLRVDPTAARLSSATVEGPRRGPAWRRLRIGAELASDGGAHFRVWAPKRTRVDVAIEGTLASRRPSAFIPLDREPGGYFSGFAADAAADTLYRYRLDGDASFPDPASRFQPEGPHGPSCIVDPTTFTWSDAGWPGRAIDGAVIYELHVGTFTPEGTWEAAARQLQALAALGVTTIEVMPIADFPGGFGWGYDGVNLFAPTRLYGTPDDMRRFVDQAHALGLSVILDVVYNHLGPDGNYTAQYSDRYVSRAHRTEWGESLNFDEDDSAPVREFIIANSGYWIDEFHLDGLRLDALQSVEDDHEEPRHLVVEIAARVRTAARGRETIIVGENEPQDARYVRPVEEGGLGLDGLWNDDWHHSAIVALTGKDEAYFSDYRGMPQELLSAAKYGFLYQGQWYRWQQARRGTPALDVAPTCFVHFLENHDQLANSGSGARIHRVTSPGRLRAMTTLLLLGPQTPMLFMGQEFAASTPFLYFADHEPQLAELVAKGRREFLSQFPSLETPEAQARLSHPTEWETFAQCKLDHAERDRNAHVLALHRDLIGLRRRDPTLSRQGAGGLDGAVLSAYAFVLRFFGIDDPTFDRVLVVNLGRALHLDPAPEPMLAPPAGSRWRIFWSSEDPRYGGLGTPPLDAPEVDRRIPTGNALRLRPRENWRIPAECAVVLGAQPLDAIDAPAGDDESAA